MKNKSKAKASLAQPPGTAHFKLTLEVVGSETDTLVWENKALPLGTVAARQAVILGAFADACGRQSRGLPIV